MSKKSDDSIERIFRQALTQYETTFRESDWLKMEKMLNEEADRRAAVRSKRIKATAFTLTGLTGLIIAVYFLAFNNPSDSIARLNDSVSEMQAAGDLRENGNVKPENPSAGLLSETSPNKALEKKENGIQSDEVRSSRSNSAGDENEDKTVEKESSPPTTTRTTIIPKGNQSKLKEGSSVQEGQSNLNVDKNFSDTEIGKEVKDRSGHTVESDGKGTPIEPPGIEKNEESLPGNNNFLDNSLAEPVIKRDDKLNRDSRLPEQAKSPVDGKSEQTPDQKPGRLISDSTQRTVVSEINPANETPELLQAEALRNNSLQKDSLPGDELLIKTKEDSIRNVKDEKAEEKPKVRPAARWSIGVIFAPEFSTTSLSRYSTPGESIGLRIGYQVSNRFNMSTGIIRSMKKYEDNGDVYQLSNPAYWQFRTNGVVPAAIDSKCLVYEVPLAIQFDAIQTQKSRVFIGTSISNYFMMNQAYDYTFEAPNPGADTGWRSQESESYWFSVGMVSAGYERYINRSLAIGIEPYLKISLADIGWGNIKLFSTGAYVTLRYKFLNRRSNTID